MRREARRALESARTQIGRPQWLHQYSSDINFDKWNKFEIQTPGSSLHASLIPSFLRLINAPKVWHGGVPIGLNSTKRNLQPRSAAAIQIGRDVARSVGERERDVEGECDALHRLHCCWLVRPATISTSPPSARRALCRCLPARCCCPLLLQTTISATWRVTLPAFPAHPDTSPLSQPAS